MVSPSLQSASSVVQHDVEPLYVDVDFDRDGRRRFSTFVGLFLFTKVAQSQFAFLRATLSTFFLLVDIFLGAKYHVN